MYQFQVDSLRFYDWDKACAIGGKKLAPKKGIKLSLIFQTYLKLLPLTSFIYKKCVYQYHITELSPKETIQKFFIH